MTSVLKKQGDREDRVPGRAALPPWRPSPRTGIQHVLGKTSLHWVVLGSALMADAAFVAVHVINVNTVDYGYLDLNREGNLPSWFSSINFFVAGQTCLFAAFGTRHRLVWLVLSALMVALSIDEVSTVHERVQGKVGKESQLLVVEPVIAALVSVLVLAMAWHLRNSARMLVFGSAVCLIAGQSAATFGYLAFEPTSFAYQLESGIEEMLEMMVGSFTLAAAVPVAVGVVAGWTRSWAATSQPGSRGEARAASSPPGVKPSDRHDGSP